MRKVMKNRVKKFFCGLIREYPVHTNWIENSYCMCDVYEITFLCFDFQTML